MKTPPVPVMSPSLQGRFFIMLLLLLLCITMHARLTAADAMRLWTDTSGRQTEASIVEVKEDRAHIKKKDGKILAVPLNNLSAPDQAYLKTWQAEQDAPKQETVARAQPAVPATMIPWPDSVSAGTDIAVQTIQEDETEKLFVYRTEHFEFRSDARLGVNVVKDIGRLFEAEYLAVKSLPLDLKPVPPEGFFLTRLYENKADYHRDGGPKGSGGVYVAKAQRILLPLESLGVKRVGSRYTIESRDDNQVLIHEITHQLMDRWFAMHMPVWLAEGMAEVMAASKYRMGRFSFVRHPDNIIAFLKAGGAVKDKNIVSNVVPSTDLMKLSYAQWASRIQTRNYTAALLLTYFFCCGDGAEDGAHLHAYLRALESGVAEPAASNRFLIRERTPEQLEAEVIKFWRKEGLEITFARPPAPKTSAP